MYSHASLMGQGSKDVLDANDKIEAKMFRNWNPHQYPKKHHENPTKSLFSWCFVHIKKIHHQKNITFIYQSHKKTPSEICTILSTAGVRKTYVLDKHTGTIR